jgi:hypothetical protein
MNKDLLGKYMGKASDLVKCVMEIPHVKVD